MTRRSTATAVAAVLGIVVSAALAWAASQLAVQRVGLSSEPFSVATGLAPHASSPRAPRRGDDHPGAARRQAPAASGVGTAQRSASSASSASPPTPSSTGSAAPATTLQATTPAATATSRSGTAGDGGPSSSAVAGVSQGGGHHGDGGDRHDD